MNSILYTIVEQIKNISILLNLLFLIVLIKFLDTMNVKENLRFIIRNK